MLSPEMMDPNAFEILTGRFEGGQIPNLQPRVVRIFLASAGADSVTERNIILERVYPELREYCRHRHGVEFQMIDLDWGVSPDEPVDDHTLPDFKLRELERCQKISGGPTFVALIGQRYGERPLYSSIPADEFDVLRMALHNHKGRETRNAPLLDKWYTRDDNSIASIYVLNNIADVIPEYAENDDQKRNQGRIRWLETRREMRRLLQKGAEYCYLEGLIPKEIRDKYVMSEMDCHLLAGVEESEDPENKCIIIFRSIVDLKNYVDDPKASRFAEIIYNEKYEQFEMENESSQLLNLMKERAIQSTSGKNILSYDVLWRYDEVISPQLHKEYLEKLSSDLIGQMKNMIDQSVPKTVYDFRSEIVQETLQHWLHCKDIARTFSGRESEFREIADYLKGTFNQPLVVFGPPGASKTTLMSKVAKESQEILAGEVITVIRYIGFTPRSSDLKQLLASICSQILSSLERNLDDLPHDFKELQKFFLALLKSIPQHIQLVLIFDSVDTILPDHSAHFMSWLPNLLNRNVKIVASTHPERNKILQRLKQEIIRNDEALLEMKPLADDDGEIMLNFFLGLYGRKITPEQMQVFKDAMQRCSLPMYVSMCAEHAKNLRSTDNIELSSLPTTIHEGINHMFDKLERKHGCILISKSMAYMVASVTGLSDCEMEDLLSLDEDVMNNVFRDYHPPVRRLPCLNWLRLKDDIRTFLIQREADGVTVCCFRQEEFNEVIRKRYLCDSDTTKEIHSMIADYFLGTWHGKAKPIKRVNCGNRVSLVPMGSEAYRQVPSQPLTFQFEGGSVKFNRRKYDQVPRHLYLAERLKELNNLVLFNYEWMYNKIKALSLQHIMADFALNPGVEAHLVEEALHVAESVIEIDINNLAPEISGHLLPYYSTMPNIRALVHQCDTDGLKHCAVLPNFPYLQVPGSSLICTLDTLVCGEFFKLFQDDRYLLMKQRESSHIHMYDLAVGERKNSIFTSNGDLHITPDGKYFIIVDHVTEKAVKIHNSSTGDFVGQLIVLNHIQLKPKERYKMGDVSVTNDRVCLIVSTDTSYLCIADIEKCAFLQIISLDGRCEICRITPGGKYVFCNSNEFLLAYDLYTLEHTCTFALGHRPNSLAFSKDGFRGYLSSSAESKLLVMHLHRGTVEMAYKTPLEEEMPDDSIMNLRVSPKDDTILVRGLDHILVYSRFNEKVIASFPRPKDIPKEFKLPKSHFINLFFTDAEYTRDGNFVIGTIFRNIYLWHISSGNLVTSIQAPVGIISELLVSSKRSQIVTHIKGATDIQVWNIDEAVNQVNMLDRLTGAITDVQVTGDSSIAYVMCKDSDEIGVIDMKTGGMLDLLTHDSPVSDFAITPSGVYVLVSTHSKKSNMATKLWDLSERKIIKEFGNAAGYCISSHDDSYIIFVSQEELNFKAPYFITVFKFIGDAFHEYTHPLALKYILEKPFLTSDDKFLVALTAQNYVRLTASYDTPTICAFSMEEDMKVSYFTPESFQGTINMKSITDLKPCLRNPYTIAVLYESNNEMDINENATSKSQTDSHSGLVILDICSGSVIAICDPFFTSATSLERGIVYANDFSFCLDAKSNLFDITKGCLRGQLPNPGVQPRLVALNGTAVVYYNENMLYVVRIKDGKQIAKCNVHAKLCHLHLCKNDRTLIAGCADGTIASYVLIDSQNEVANDVIVTLRSRKVGETIDLDGRLSRSWDKIENGGCSPHSRPVSAAIHGPKDKVLLKRIKPAPKIRPNSDTFMYLNSNSKSCSVM